MLDVLEISLRESERRAVSLADAALLRSTTGKEGGEYQRSELVLARAHREAAAAYARALMEERARERQAEGVHCATCGGSGGGHDGPLRCPSCRGSGRGE